MFCTPCKPCLGTPECNPFEQLVTLLLVERYDVHRKVHFPLVIDRKTLFIRLSQLLLVLRLVISKLVLTENVLLLSVLLEQRCTLGKLCELVELVQVLALNYLIYVFPCDLLVLIINRRGEHLILAVHF